jgi:hemerythrin-like metal-binding protein
MTTARTVLAEYEAQKASPVPPVFVWNARYETGLNEVDEQHRRLVDIINHVDRLLRAESPLSVLEPTLDELTEYAKYHFATEERLMDALKCEPGHVERHKRAHEEFARQIETMRAQANLNPVQFIPTLLRFLSTWIVHHILTTDQDFARQVFAIRGGAPLERAYVEAGANRPDPAAEALLEALNRLYDDVARRNIALAELNQELRSRERELRMVQDELHQANKDLEKRLADGERRLEETRRAFEAQRRADASAPAAGASLDGGTAQQIASAMTFAVTNLEIVGTCAADLFRVIEEYEKVHLPSARTAADEAHERHDHEVLERLRGIVFEMLSDSKERLKRVAQTVSDLQRTE